MSSRDRSSLKPVLGFFYLSKAERVVFSFLTFFLGSIITSYKNMDIFRDLMNHKEHDSISSWYTIPFLLFCYLLLDPVVEPRWLRSMRVKITTSRDALKVFIIDVLFGMLFLIILQILYAFSTYFLFLSLWG